jgi:hypothetical protein
VAQLFDTATMAPIEVPDADAPAHVLSGRYGLDSNAKVLLRSPDGEMVTMDGRDAPRAFELGYVFTPQGPLRSEEIEQQYGKVGGKVLALGAGAARGASFGLSDMALRHAGVQAKTLRTLEEGAPITSTVGQVGGALAPLLLSGGASAAAEGVSLAGSLPRAAAGIGRLAGKAALQIAPRGSSLLARAGAKAVQLGAEGAAEGALYGAGEAITEDALGRADLNAESLIAHVGLGAALGLGAGGLLGFGGSLAGAGVRRAGKAISDRAGRAAGSLEEIANESAVKATGARGVDIRKLQTPEKIAQVGSDIRGYRFDDGSGILDNAPTNETVLSRVKKAKEEVGGRLGSLREKVDDLVHANPDEAFDPGVVLTRIRQEVLDPLRESGVPEVRAKANKVLRSFGLLQDAWEGGHKLSPKTLTKFRKDLDSIIYPKKPKGGGLSIAPAHAEELVKARGIMEDWIEENTERVLAKFSPDDAGRYGDLRRQSESFIKAAKLGEKSTLQDLGNRTPSLTDYLSGLGGMALGDPVSAGLAMGANYLMRTRGRGVVAQLAGKAAKLGVVQRAAQSTNQRLTGSISRLVDKGRGVAAPVAAINVLFDTPFLPTSAPRPVSRRDAAKQRSKELAQLMADPSRVADRIAASTAGLDEAAPNIATQAAMVATRALQFLHAKAPKSTQTTHTAQPLLDDWEPSDAEASQFERYMKAALDPVSVLDDLANGTITQEGAETLRELYPQLREMALGTIAAKLSESRERLPYADRVNLSILFGVPADDTMRPEFIARLQKTWTPQPSPVGQSGGGGGNLGMADNMRTSTQRLEVKP